MNVIDNKTLDPEISIFDDKSNAKDAIQEKLFDLNTPGFQVEFDPGEAEEVGAFVEDAIPEDDALDSSTDTAAEE